MHPNCRPWSGFSLCPFGRLEHLLKGESSSLFLIKLSFSRVTDKHSQTSFLQYLPSRAIRKSICCWTKLQFSTWQPFRADTSAWLKASLRQQRSESFCRWWNPLLHNFQTWGGPQWCWCCEGCERNSERRPWRGRKMAEHLDNRRQWHMNQQRCSRLTWKTPLDWALSHSCKARRGWFDKFKKRSVYL